MFAAALEMSTSWEDVDPEIANQSIDVSLLIGLSVNELAPEIKGIGKWRTKLAHSHATNRDESKNT